MAKGPDMAGRRANVQRVTLSAQHSRRTEGRRVVQKRRYTNRNNSLWTSDYDNGKIGGDKTTINMKRSTPNSQEARKGRWVKDINVEGYRRDACSTREREVARGSRKKCAILPNEPTGRGF